MDFAFFAAAGFGDFGPGAPFIPKKRAVCQDLLKRFVRRDKIGHGQNLRG